MAVLQIYDKLLQFPLFQGMSRDDLEIVAGHTRFGFQKVAAGRQVISVGNACNNLYFLINGMLRIETFGDEHRYTVVEQMSAPYILQQEGIIYNRRGVGYFASPDAKEKILAIQRREFLEEDLPVIKQKMRLLGISIDELTLDDVI